MSQPATEMSEALQAPHSHARGAYTVTQAAQILGIDLKTLKKRMKSEGILPIVPEDDHRLRLLSERHLEQLRGSGSLDSVGKTPRAAAVMGEAARMFKRLANRIARIEERLAQQEEETNVIKRQLDEANQLEQLKREIIWRTEEWERTAGALRTILTTLQSEFIHNDLSPSAHLAENRERANDVGSEVKGLNLGSPAEVEKVAKALISALSTCQQDESPEG